MAIEKASPLPKYQQLQRYLHEQISSGKFRPGTRIPGDHEMADRFNVSRITVRRAIAQLQEEGYVSREPGRGTFVNAPESRQLDAGDDLLHIAMLYADTRLDADYNVHQIRIVERLLHQHNGILSIASLDGAAVAAGEFPLLLQHDRVQGVLIDGHVHDFHCAAIEKRGLPYVVMGNHAVARHYPQVRFDVNRTTRDAIARLQALRPGVPVALLVEPFALYYTREIYSAYETAVASLQQPILLFPCPDDAGDSALDVMLDRGMEKFSILTTDRIAKQLLRRYAERGLTPEDHPIAVIGLGRLRPDEAAKVCPFGLAVDQLADAAVNALLERIRFGPREVFVELVGGEACLQEGFLTSAVAVEGDGN